MNGCVREFVYIYSLKLTIQAVKSVTRPDIVGYRWRQVTGTVTRVAVDVLY